jgi:trk system potassium uptake protein TrkH
MVNVFDWDLMKLRVIHPAALILFSYLFAMGAGTFMLLTPYSIVEEDISFIEAMYTATSAVCVTGLTVVDTGPIFPFLGSRLFCC